MKVKLMMTKNNIFLLIFFFIISYSQCFTQCTEAYIRSFLKYKRNNELLNSSINLINSEEYLKAEKQLSRYSSYIGCDYLNLQFYIARLVYYHNIKNKEKAREFLFKAIKSGYDHEYSSLPKWSKYATAKEIDSLENLYLSSLNLPLSLSLTKILDDDQSSRKSKDKRLISEIDSINKIRFDNIVDEFNLPKLCDYGNSFTNGTHKIDFSLSILLIHFGSSYWEKYIDQIIDYAYNDQIEWTEVQFLMNAIFIRQSSKDKFIQIKYLGNQDIKEYLMFESMKEVLAFNNVKIDVIYYGKMEDEIYKKFNENINPNFINNISCSNEIPSECSVNNFYFRRAK